MFEWGHAFQRFTLITEFILTVLILGITIYFAINLYGKMQTIKKFKKQEIQYYENKNLLSTNNIVNVFIILFSLITLISFIVFIFKPSNGFYYFNETFFFIVIIFCIVYITYFLRIINSAIIVVKNNTLILIDQIISINQIIKFERDLKRKWISIFWKDQEIEKNINLTKLKYNYELKDFLQNIAVENNFN